MNVLAGTHLYYCGIDLHARFMYICILDSNGDIVYHKNCPCTPEHFFKAIAPFREDIVVGVECIFCWYWLADLCEEEGIDFILGHAFYMKAIHGVKTKNDRIDSLKIARLMRGGNFPLAYVYPPKMRATRDLMRRRIHFVRKRAELLGHILQYHQPVQPACAGHALPASSPPGQRHCGPFSGPRSRAYGRGRPKTYRPLRPDY